MNGGNHLPWQACLLTALLVAVVGCGDGEAKKDEKKKAEKPKPDYEWKETVNLLMPERTSSTAPQIVYVKPGHQTTLSVVAAAHYRDFRGTLNWHFPGAPDGLHARRSVILPKEQRRHLEFSTYFPTHPPQALPRLQVDIQSTGFSGLTNAGTQPAVQAIPAYQYQFAVLARTPDTYRSYIEKLYAIRFPSDALDETLLRNHYQVVYPRKDEPASLPRGLLHWTSTAYLLWDDFDPEQLDEDERASLMDWLHWGGQLIVSGPDTLETLQTSFLTPYLPATTDATIELDAADLSPLNSQPWLRDYDPIKPLKPWSGVRLKPAEAAQTLLDSHKTPLLVERRIGRGRIVVSAFRLDQRGFVEWQGHEGVWHSCLMRRAPRRFTKIDTDDPSFQALVDWANGDSSDPRLVTDVRLFSRDTGTEVLPEKKQQDSDPFASPRYPTRRSVALPIGDEPELQRGGCGAWTDQNQVASAAHQALLDAAGIVVPERTFVVRILAVYLALLVPANWLLFRLINRVEWAWFAVPVMAVVFTGLVAWLAQVNVGFARARSEVAIVELQTNHPRAHVTRYTALYSSLGTAYEVECQGGDSLALPMTVADTKPLEVARSLRIEYGNSRDGDRSSPVTRLTGFEVGSNSTDLLHIEQMREVGAIECQRIDVARFRLTNRTALSITGGVVGKSGTNWLGSLPAGESIDFNLNPAGQPLHWNLDATDDADRLARVSGIQLDKLVHVAVESAEADELRFVGWCADDVGGVTITPDAVQRRIATMIVAHLDYGPLRPIQPDFNGPPKK